MNPRFASEMLILLTILAWVGWDLWIWRTYGYEATITAVIRFAVRAHPLVPAAIGALASHFLAW